MEKTDKLIINLILDKNAKVKDGDFEKFEDLKQLMGINKPNTEIIRSCIRSTHKQLLG